MTQFWVMNCLRMGGIGKRTEETDWDPLLMMESRKYSTQRLNYSRGPSLGIDTQMWAFMWWGLRHALPSNACMCGSEDERRASETKLNIQQIRAQIWQKPRLWILSSETFLMSFRHTDVNIHKYAFLLFGSDCSNESAGPSRVWTENTHRF